jgi:arginase
MFPADKNIEIISAPSILGLKPTGVETLGESLLAAGLAQCLHHERPIIYIETLNHLYQYERDKEDNCLNSKAIKDFSITLGSGVSNKLNKETFPIVLGGDCSILIGIMSALKAKGNYGLVFLDAHADFYQPEKSITGEVADMDLAIVTGRGPDTLTNINGLQPYVKDENVIHLGQRDWEETRKFQSQDIRETAISCFSLADIEDKGIQLIASELQRILKLDVEGFWIHFDTDVLSDDINPAVDYRIPGGLTFAQIETFIRTLLRTGRMSGMSITIFNPRLDDDGLISKNIAESLGRAFK